MTTAVTRGHGLLEGFLARQRANMANELIPPAARDGLLLDIGCGSFPFFLSRTEFAEKYGLDKVIDDVQKREFEERRIHLINHDLTAPVC